MELLRCPLPLEQTPQSLSTPGVPPQMVHPDTAEEIEIFGQSLEIRPISKIKQKNMPVHSKFARVKCT